MVSTLFGARKTETKHMMYIKIPRRPIAINPCTYVLHVPVKSKSPFEIFKIDLNIIEKRHINYTLIKNT